MDEMGREIGVLKKYTSDADETLKKKAHDDLNYLCGTLGGYSLFHNVQYAALIYGAEKLCNFLIVPHDMAQKKVVFSTEHLKFNDGDEKLKLYVAVICYEDGEPTGAYLINSSEFKKAGFFSIFGLDKKNGTASIDLSNKAKLNVYSFGNVIKSFGKGG